MITSFFKPKTRSSKTTEQTSELTSTKREREEDESKEETGENTNSNGLIQNKRPKATTPLCSEVEELLSFMEGNAVGENDAEPSTSANDWKHALHRHLSSAAFASLAKFVAKERKAHTIFPLAKDTFSALNVTPLDKVRVVIVGQDPYHGPGQAHGLCFSVLPGEKVPPSLKNIYKELREDAAVNFANSPPTHGHLMRWAKQGVLMTNNVLTVRRGEANSHKKRGWEVVTDEIIRAVDRHSRATGKGVVFLLWGKPAAAKTQALLSNKSRHTVISTSHPSPLGARKTDQPFLGSRCFSRCNDALKEMGYPEVDWNVDGDL
jgi:uracil-DNA glycosylase